MPKPLASEGQEKERSVSCCWGNGATGKGITRRATHISQPRSGGYIWFLILRSLGKMRDAWMSVVLTASSARVYLWVDEQCTGFGRLLWVTSITRHRCLEGSLFQVLCTVKLHGFSQINKWDKGRAATSRSTPLWRDEEHKTSHQISR